MQYAEPTTTKNMQTRKFVASVRSNIMARHGDPTGLKAGTKVVLTKGGRQVKATLGQLRTMVEASPLGTWTPEVLVAQGIIDGDISFA